jgi:hypothetical protein
MTTTQTNNYRERETVMKALETVKLVEVTLVLSIETYGGNQTLCGMDHIVVQDEAQVLGWSERDLEIKPKEEVTA